MSKQTHHDLWVSRDGSFGFSPIALFNTAEWTNQQHDWFIRHTNEAGNEPEVDVVSQIDRNIEPLWEFPEDSE
jgi:hypothetical protein